MYMPEDVYRRRQPFRDAYGLVEVRGTSLPWYRGALNLTSDPTPKGMHGIWVDPGCKPFSQAPFPWDFGFAGLRRGKFASSPLPVASGSHPFPAGVGRETSGAKPSTRTGHAGQREELALLLELGLVDADVEAPAATLRAAVCLRAARSLRASLARSRL